MSLSYFNVKKLRRQSKQPETEQNAVETSPPAPAVASPSEEPATSPILDEEDEKFLHRLASIANEPEGTPPALPERPVVILEGGEAKVGRDAQEALMAGADKVPLPSSPPPVSEGSPKGKGKATPEWLNRKSVSTYFSLAQSKFKRSEKDASKEKNAKKLGKGKEKEKATRTDKDREMAADSLHSAAEQSRAAAPSVEAQEQDLSAILDQLNLSAVNNRVFSFSKESEDLLNKFKVVLKDLVNGVPTAYNDLEKLLTDSDAQMKKMYGSLPPFLQNLVKSLPAKMTAALPLGPELLAAGADKPGFDAKQRAAASGTGSKEKSKKSKRARIPSLKSLLSAEGAVATMLRSILNFLKLRFPAMMTGTNVLLSLAVFLLLFVFWYCHKRGRETRLEKEGLTAQEGDSALASSASSVNGDDADSIFGAKAEASGSVSKDETQAEPPLIINDGREEQSAALDNMPSVSHLPDPVTAPSSGSQAPLKDKVEALKSPENK